MSQETLAVKRFQFSGRWALHSTVRLGSGAGPRLYRVLSMRKQDLVTRGRPSSPMPPTLSVIHMGSPPNSSLYSGVRRCRAIRSFKTKSSKISWACSSVRTPAFRSRSK